MLKVISVRCSVAVDVTALASHRLFQEPRRSIAARFAWPACPHRSVVLCEKIEWPEQLGIALVGDNWEIKQAHASWRLRCYIDDSSCRCRVLGVSLARGGHSQL